MTLKSHTQIKNYERLLVDIESFYPNFKTWYSTKVIPGIINDTREILTEYREDTLVGIAIIKKEKQEQKICTIKIIPEYQNRGIGVKLFKRALNKLSTDKPFVTVPEERFHEFHKIFIHFGFKLTEVKTGYYRKGKKEYIYNGSLKD
ncbi:N-acetyltransferase [Arcobacter sp. F155]|uniref:GNAT family N-acetyltransferase n=1 Tax=Arcobacter sp. F155 TaxID=2044512 RepID=UPI00100AD153|nr:GNAT family N-acetyltransferase [Arcobacter sp. F155]RXJ77207.1 N-acetyltransferase [Arcobacter sp. F155]